MKHILFVDDEPNILQGLRRMLRGLRHEFTMHFAASGREALELMRQQEIDVIVSDMRMPGMDGATLLEDIRRDYPHTIRIMLSGQADEQAILRTIGVVHRFIAKPSGPDQLKAVLENAAAIHTMLSDGAMKNLISEIGSLPSVPTVFARLQRLLVSDNTSVEEVAEVIEQDMAMSAKVLQLVNSAFFGLYQQVDRPARAVALLGLDTIRALVLGMEVFSQMPNGNDTFAIEDLWEHSLRTADIARRIVLEEKGGKEMAGHAFIAGLLHDLGKLILTSRMPNKYREALRLAEKDNISLHEAERRVFGVGHCPVGAYLLGLWGLPGCEVEAVAFHHNLAGTPEEGLSLPMIVAAADRLAHDIAKTEDHVGQARNVAPRPLHDQAERIARWREAVPRAAIEQ